MQNLFLYRTFEKLNGKSSERHGRDAERDSWSAKTQGTNCNNLCPNQSLNSTCTCICTVYVCDTMVSICIVYLKEVVAGKITVYDLHVHVYFDSGGNV